MVRLCQKCRRQATFNSEGSEPAYCKKHAEDGMVDVRHHQYCLHNSCMKGPNFNLEGNKKGAYCKQHAKDGMVDVRSRCCSHEPCTTQARFGIEGNKATVFCRKHAKDGMVDVCSKRCLHDSCTKRPNFNFEGKKKAYCKQHAEDGMVNVLNQRCLHDSCTKRPSFNFEGRKEAYCKLHAEGGMISIVFARRSSNGSGTVVGAARREPTDGAPTACAQVKKELFLDDPVMRISPQQSEVGKACVRRSKHCSHESCTTYANYRFEGDNNAKKTCKKHAEDGMVNVNGKRCLHDSCTKRSNFNFEGKKKAYCKQHAEDGMVNVVSQRCLHDSCTKRPSFNFKGRKKAYCKLHAEDGMISIVFARRSSNSNGSCTVVGTALRIPPDDVPTVGVRLKREILDDPVTSVSVETVSGAAGRLNGRGE
ncbi:unnamed protein product [Laminaria digitata]